MKRTADESARTRESILEHALIVLAEHGYRAARLESIAERAGVTRGAVYHHFGSKRELVRALVERHLGAFDVAVEEALGEATRQEALHSGAAALEAVIVEPLARLEGNPSLAAFFELVHLRLGGAPELAEVREARRAQVAARMRALASLVRAGVASGAFASRIDPDAVARSVVALQHGVMLTWIELGRSYSLATAAADAAGVFVDGLAAAPGARHGGSNHG